MPLQKNQIIPLAIEGISSDGNGVGRWNGMAVFVPYTAKGDELTVKIVKTAKQYAFGRIEEVVRPGPGRQAPDCSVFGMCGGCSFRHLTYEAELEVKQTSVQDAVTRLGKLDFTADAILPSPLENRYRNKVQYPIASGTDGRLVYGFYAHRSHRVVPCQDCMLQPQAINQLIQSILEILQQQGVDAYDEASCKGLIRHITVRHGTYSGQLLVCLVLNGASLPDNKAFVKALCSQHPDVASIVINTNRNNTNVIHGKESHVIYGSGAIDDTLSGVPMRLNEHTFAQVNTPAAEQLFALVQQYAEPGEETTMLDLYCGTGVIGLSMAKHCKTLIGVEVVAESVESARLSAANMGLKNTRFLCADAGEAAAQLRSEGVRPDVVVLDPPRKGVLPKAIEAVLAMAPARIIIVSCNPATMARDLAVFCHHGYAVVRLQPVDLFPRTKHVECVCLLVKTPR